MSLPKRQSLRQSLPGLVFGLVFTSAASAQALDVPQGAMVYVFSVTAPALRSACDQVIPDYAQNFDGRFSDWRENNAQEILASRAALQASNPGKTPTEVEELIASSARDDFAGADQERKEQTCNGLMGYMTASDFG